MHEAVIVGSAVAGEAAKARLILESLIKNIDKQTLDVAELLFKVQTEGLYQPDYNTYKEYTRAIKIKDSRAEYLPRIIRIMNAVGIERKKYEHLAIGRLREIASLDKIVNDNWVNPENQEQTPIKEFVTAFVDKGEEIELEDLKKHIRTLKGLTGENDLTWFNVCVKRAAMDKTIRPALEKVKAIIGSVGKDDEGVSQDASDGAALEMAMAEILADETLGMSDGPQDAE